MIRKEARKISKLPMCHNNARPAETPYQTSGHTKPSPWGGLSVDQNIEMIYTYTIDNILYFLHILFINRADILQDFQKKDNVAFRILIKVHLMFKDN